MNGFNYLKGITIVLVSFLLIPTISIFIGIEIDQLTYFITALPVTVICILYMRVRNKLILVESKVLHAEEKQNIENEKRKKFISDISHEIRTPMNGIIGMLTLLERSDLSPKQQKHVRIIKSCSDSLLSLLSDAVDYTNIVHKGVVLERLALDLHSIIDDLKGIFEAEFANKGIQLIISRDPNVPEMVFGDEPRIRHILIVLLGHVIKHAGMGVIKLHASSNRLNGSAHNISFSIIDSTKAFTNEDNQEVLDAFNQADNLNNKRYEGMGLGLAITYRLINLMGGEIGVNSLGEKGVNYYVNLPLNEARRAFDPVEATVEFTPSFNESLKILVVEDDKVSLKVITSFLSELKYQADYANNGEEALALALKNDYDCVLMDIHMPKMDGIVATKLIKRMHRDRSPQIYAISASILNEDIEKYKEAGIDGLIPKPITLEGIQNCISESERINQVKPNKHTPRFIMHDLKNDDDTE